MLTRLRFSSFPKSRGTAVVLAHRTFASLPNHVLLPLPALSPTMTEGTISSWQLKEGDQINPGDVICEIETDKATVDYEAQEEGYLAKILVKEGVKNIKVGLPIGVVVEDQASIAAFKDFVPSSASPAKDQPKQASPEKAPEPPKIKVDETPKVKVDEAPAPKQFAAKEKPMPIPKPAVVPSGADTDTKKTPKQVSTSSADKNALLFKFKSPLQEVLARKQQEYHQKFGSTFMIPISSPETATVKH